MSRLPIEELAAKYVLLQEARPALPIKWQDRTPPSEETIEKYRAHMHQEYLLYNELIMRAGLDPAIQHIKRAKGVLEMMTP